MTDRELLELAAKAAGVEQGAERTEWGISTTLSDGRHGYLPHWNPLTDDGDALRLALKLGIQIGDPHQYADLALAHTDGRLPFNEYWERIKNGDYYSATRRAIVRAAAEIGSTME